MTTSTTHTLSGSAVSLLVVLTEPSASLTALAGTVDWGDGSTTDIPRTTKVLGSVTVSLTHTYAVPGFYVIKTTGRNFRSPTPDTDLAILYLDLGAVAVAEVNRGFLRGPVLPETAGAGRWIFNAGSDMEVIASDLRNLFMTKQGERLMLPDFGTQIHRLIFEPDTALLETQVQQEISQAVSKYEPRVAIVAVSAERLASQRQLAINVQVRALNQFLTLGLNYS